MSACNNILLGRSGSFAGYALALYIEQQVQEESSESMTTAARSATNLTL